MSRDSEGPVIDRTQFVVVVAWLLLLATVLVFILPDLELPSTAMRSRHSLRLQSTIHIVNLIAATLDLVFAISRRLPQDCATLFCPANQLLALECTRLC